MAAFDQPFGIAIDSSDNIFVADVGDHLIQKFDADGNFITSWGGFGTGNGQFNSPWSLAVDSADNIYVVDAQNHRVQKFSNAGAYITQWGSFGTADNQFNNMGGICFNPSNGLMYIGDKPSAAVPEYKIFSTGGSFVSKTTLTSGDPPFIFCRGNHWISIPQ